MNKISLIDPKNEYNDWFNSPFYHKLYNNRDYSEAKKFISKLLNYLSLKKNSTILDAACGKGRHSIQLEKLGYNVTGIDLSENSINEAKKSENRNLKFLIHDISKPLNIKHDAVFNLFTSFGYSESKEKDVQILNSIKQNLKKNGTGVIDFFNIINIKKNLVPNDTVTKEGIEFKISRKIEDNMVVKNISFIDKDILYSFKEKVNALTLKDFKDYFNKTNLDLIKVFGDYNLKNYDPNLSERLIIIFKNK